MKTSSKMLFVSMLFLSTIMVISSSSWINMWIGLEINLMSFIPMISKSKNSFMSQSTMMYFLIQSMASMMFIVIILMNKHMFINLNTEWIKMMIIISMMMKMGMPPFHLWFPEMMNKMSWEMCFVLMTWQKIAPMYVMSMVIEMNNMVTTLICLSAVVGAIGGINQTSTRKIMAYSSIMHMSWMITCAASFKKSWMIYMTLYMMMMGLLTMLMFEYNMLFVNQMNFFSLKKVDKMIIFFLILSMGGMPPFLGFLPKWISIQYMISSKEFLMMLVMMVSSLITLSYYMRMSSSMNLIMSTSQKWMNMFNTNKKIPTYIFSVNMMLPIIILMMNFY